MRKWQPLVWILCVLFFSSSIYAYAATVPERTGTVTDPAGLFTAAQAKQLEEGLKASSYELVVLTARGFNEEAIQQLGNEAYNTWKLKGHQLLLLVAADPSSVQLVYDNEQVAEAVSRSEAGNNQGIIDLNYKPLAASGNPVEGIIAVSNYMNALKVPLAAAPPTPSSPSGATTAPIVPAIPPVAGEAPTPPLPVAPLVPAPTVPMDGVPIPLAPSSDQDAVPAEAGAASAGYKPLSSGTLIAIAAILLLAFMIVFIVRRSMLLSRTRKVLEEAKALHKDAESKMNSWAVEPRADVDEVVKQLQADSRQLREQLATNQHQVAFLSKALDQQEVESLYNEVQIFAQRVELYQEMAGADLTSGGETQL
ncbi:TPM domain-containing protein [Paenibacillus agricola]|uniref:TPM domain-containing protein n=1 Tax=Paenibacillus agricola TaxID=2716264 RepID=A0ABX0J7F9_9BACL|nr:TPM domain-containing protein [Paenibacillus agricola]NHN32072.1 hypothetical protein [Paenibacillus agricola]